MNSGFLTVMDRQPCARVYRIPGYLALRDRDFLMDDEIRAIRLELPNLHILPFYSIENLLYHPENIGSLEIADFDAGDWISAIREWKSANPLREVKHERGRIQELRTIPSLAKAKAAEADPKEIYDAYASDDFERFYPVFPQQRMPLDFLSRFGLARDRLARAPWFRRQVRAATMPPSGIEPEFSV